MYSASYWGTIINRNVWNENKSIYPITSRTDVMPHSARRGRHTSPMRPCAVAAHPGPWCAASWATCPTSLVPVHQAGGQHNTQHLSARGAFLHAVRLGSSKGPLAAVRDPRFHSRWHSLLSGTQRLRAGYDLVLTRFPGRNDAVSTEKNSEEAVSSEWHSFIYNWWHMRLRYYLFPVNKSVPVNSLFTHFDCFDAIIISSNLSIISWVSRKELNRVSTKNNRILLCGAVELDSLGVSVHLSTVCMMAKC